MSSNIKLVVLLVALIAVLVLAGLGYNYLSEDYENTTTTTTVSYEQPSEQSQTATDFTVIDKDGNEVKLSDFFGKPTVVNFWATWCGPCKSELPAFQNMYNKYGEDVNFLMVNLTDGYRETVEGTDEFISQNGYDFDVYFDTQYSAANAYGVYSIPMTLFVSENGALQDTQIGAMNEATLENYIKGLMN